jgi:predicted permease
VTHIVKALLRLYPPLHRQRYETEMLQAALLRWSRAGRTKAATVSVLFDLITGAAGVWKDSISRGTTGMGIGSGWGLDARYELRSLWKSRGYIVTAVVVLACAVAVNAVVYSYVWGTLLYEPPYEDPQSVVVVWGSNTVNGQLRDVVSGPNFIDVQEQVRTLETVAAFHNDGAYLMADGRPEPFEALEVTADFFRLLGVTPVLGRVFGDDDRMSGAPDNLVVTYAFWRDRLGSDPSVIGTMLNFEGAPKNLIGVLPEGFEFIMPAPLFIPLRDDLLAADARTRIHYNVLGRLAPGTSVADANAELNAILARIIAQHPQYEGWSFLVEPLHAVSVASVRPVIRVLSVTAALVLLAALVNLATLFRIRAHSRAGELSVRAALGAGRFRLARLVALETGGLAAVGAAAGLIATPFMLERVAAMLPTVVAIPESAARVPVLRAVLGPDVIAVAFLSAVSGALVLTVPGFLLGFRKREVATRARSRLHGMRLLVGVELAVATMLCVGAGLTARSASHLLTADVGIDPDGLLTMYFGDVWGLEVDERVSYIREVAEQVERVPGVERAGVIDYVAFQAEDDYARVYFLDRSHELEPLSDLREEWRRVDAVLFDAAGMTIVAGRGIEPADTFGKVRVAVVNEAFATKHYPNRNPVGEFLSTHDEAYRDMEIVGVVADVRSLGPAAPAPPMLYVPFQGSPRGTQGLYVRVVGAGPGEGEPSALAARIQDAIWAVDSSQPIEGITPMSELVGAWVAIPRATRALVSGLAALAWLLSAVGVFGVVAFTVGTRQRELGIRMALGATPGRLKAEQLRVSSPVLVLGIGVGLVAAVLTARAAQGVLFGVSAMDVPSLAGAVAVMAIAAGVATYLPVRRASRTAPTAVIGAD